jgi:hypothetical protein
MFAAAFSRYRASLGLTRREAALAGIPPRRANEIAAACSFVMTCRAHAARILAFVSSDSFMV